MNFLRCLLTYPRFGPDMLTAPLSKTPSICLTRSGQKPKFSTHKNKRNVTIVYNLVLRFPGIRGASHITRLWHHLRIAVVDKFSNFARFAFKVLATFRDCIWDGIAQSV